jgi:hypothetical protein
VGGLLLLLAAGACRLELFSVPKRPARDGYRAVFVSGDGKKYPIAVRPGKRRIEIGLLARIVTRGDSAEQTVLLRADRRLYFESASRRDDEVFPGYELDPSFDPRVRLAGHEFLELGDDVQAGHVCALYRIWSSPTDSLVYWVAKDLDRLVVRMEWQRQELGEQRDLRMEELVGVRPGADESLFRVPEGYRRAATRDEILK